MIKIIAVHGSPRRKGNSSALLREAIKGATEAGAQITEFTLRDLKISPCMEIYGCTKSGECVIKDEYSTLRDAILEAEGLMLASPVFFYSVSAHTKIFMDRCQSLWVKKYQIEKTPFKENRPAIRKGLFISVGATRGKKLFDGILLSIRYFFDVFDMELFRSVLCRGVDEEGEILNHPDRLREAYEAGRALAESLMSSDHSTA